MIRFRCQECGKKLKADEKIVGRKVKCTRCPSIETVPPTDNLTQPAKLASSQDDDSQSSQRLNTTKPKPMRRKPASFKMGPPDLIAGDEPVELFGHSGPSVSVATEKFEPKFKAAKTRKPTMRRNVILGLVGLGVIGAIAIITNLGWILDAGRKLSTDYENFEEVKYYRNAVSQLERSRRMMEIAGEAYIRIRAVSVEEQKEFAEYNARIQSKTTKSDMLEKVEKLFRAGDDVKAKALLVNTGVELGKLQKEVEQKAQEYTDMTY